MRLKLQLHGGMHTFEWEHNWNPSFFIFSASTLLSSEIPRVEIFPFWS